MSKFVISIEQDDPLKDGQTLAIPYPAAESLQAQTVLIARRTGSMSLVYLATGTLQSDQGGTAEISDLRILPKEVQAFRFGPEDVFEISDEEFDDVLAQQTGQASVGENHQVSLDSVSGYTAELAATRRNRCDFSGVRTYGGGAFIIRPLEQGGTWLPTNFLFLDPEAGTLFANFAWSVGPRYEIIIDAHAVTAGISDTVNRTGLLALPERPDLWPDRSALAWHFDQFTRRLTSGRD